MICFFIFFTYKTINLFAYRWFSKCFTIIKCFFMQWHWLSNNIQNSLSIWSLLSVKSEKNNAWTFIQKDIIHTCSEGKKSNICFDVMKNEKEWKKIKSLSPTTNNVFADTVWLHAAGVSYFDQIMAIEKKKKRIIHPFRLVPFVKHFYHHCVPSCVCTTRAVGYSKRLIDAFCSHIAHPYENNEWVVASE